VLDAAIQYFEKPCPLTGLTKTALVDAWSTKPNHTSRDPPVHSLPQHSRSFENILDEETGPLQRPSNDFKAEVAYLSSELQRKEEELMRAYVEIAKYIKENTTLRALVQTKLNKK
jgi:hypothetical protein